MTFSVSNQAMTTKAFATTISLFLGLTAFLPTLQVAQQAEGAGAFKPFVGTWKGICADGAEFIILKLSQSRNEVRGTVSIANMNGPHGQCASVIDPLTDEHAMKIHDVQLQGKALAFKGAGQTVFEVTVVSDGEATLKFFGTPAESHPWKLKLVK